MLSEEEYQAWTKAEDAKKSTSGIKADPEKLNEWIEKLKMNNVKKPWFISDDEWEKNGPPGGQSEQGKLIVQSIQTGWTQEADDLEKWP